MYEKRFIQTSNPFKNENAKGDIVRNIYYGEVVSTDDDTDGGKIKVRVEGLDSKIPNENLPDAYPLLPKFIHLYPKVGETVRIFIPDVRYPNSSRFWMGSVISQLQNINFENRYTALSTTNLGITSPLESVSKIPTAKGVFPKKEDVALIGRCNTDIILREREVEIRAGKHEVNNVVSLNKTNPASIKLSYDISGNSQTQTTVSTNIINADRIALITHKNGNPNFKNTEIDFNERNRIFEQGHPLGRGDVIVEALELLRRAILEHIHAYPKLPTDRSGVIIDLQNVDFTQILQRNIVTN